MILNALSISELDSNGIRIQHEMLERFGLDPINRHVDVMPYVVYNNWWSIYGTTLYVGDRVGETRPTLNNVLWAFRWSSHIIHIKTSKCGKYRGFVMNLNGRKELCIFDLTNQIT